MRIAVVIILLGCAKLGIGQDSLSTLSYQQFLGIVSNHHPIAYSAQYKAEMGQAKVLKARGSFDPKLEGTFQQKRYSDKEYYALLNTGFKIPTWFGITVHGGYENNTGQYLNPESTTPYDGLWNLGGTLNIGQGLFIDQRRASLAQAKLMRSSSLLEQKIILNALLFDASIAYWDWFKAFNKLKIYEEGLQIAQNRFEGIKRSVALGDKPAVDTLKSYIQVQERRLKLEQSRLDLQNKQQQLEVYLWKEGFVPLEINTLTPAEFTATNYPSPSSDLIAQLDQFTANHPELQQMQNQIDIAHIEWRLKRENLKPSLEVKYNSLSPSLENIDFNNYDIDNYKWGAKASFPLFVRKELGDLKIAKLELQDLEAKNALKIETIKFKISKSINTWQSYEVQILLQENNLQAYTELYKAENQLFQAGESSMFLVNTRDTERINAHIKFIEMLTIGLQEKALFDYHTFGF